ncbi:MAG: DUF4105 domain-containing protein [Bacteroides sp.]|nr:DUF4105 domain-containing protein [Bacteroides sp.]
MQGQNVAPTAGGRTAEKDVAATETPEAGGDSIRISLLTCSAGEEIYSLFGHTAIRCENLTRGIDLVFNYGVFDFGAPNFILRFALGETDYRLGILPYKRFARDYHYDGRDVWQQTLNLRQEEKERLMELLDENYKPENRVYRYNFFYDNCATRPRDMVEKAIDGTLQYADDMEDTHTGITFRDVLHRYSEGHAWSRFGMDLCMGSKADVPISRRTLMFVPFYVQECFGRAEVVDKAGNARPLVAAERKIVSAAQPTDPQRSDGISPMQCTLLLLVLVAGATAYGIRRGKSLWGIDVVIFVAAGVAGCILAFLALFSQHPAVSPNYLLFVLHPLHLLCLPWMANRVRKGQKSWYMALNCVVLIFFILLWPVIPQKFDLTVLPLALCLLIRSVSNLVLTHKKK